MANTAMSFAEKISRGVIKYRWLLMFGISMLALLLEFSEHNIASLRNPASLNPFFVREVLLFVVLLPVSWGLLLTMLAHFENERQKVEYELDQQTTLGQQLSQTRHYEELTQHIVQFPRTVVPVTAASLHLYNPGQNRFELAAHWSLDGEADATLMPYLAPELCQACELIHAKSPLTVMPCPNPRRVAGRPQSSEYCLPLVVNERPVALLHMRFPAEITLATNQMRALASASHEMALALEGARLQQSFDSQVAASESERKRVAQNLHDTLGQNISYLRLKLDQLSGDDALWEISQVKLELERMRAIADLAYHQVRGTLAELDPVKTVDLVASLQGIARQASERASFQLQFHKAGKPRHLPPQTNRQVLFICREVLNNIEKHAQAKQVQVDLLWGERDLTLKICDDGVGFDPASAEVDGHYGLTIMRERAEEIEGRLTITSGGVLGSEVKLWLPLPAEGARPAAEPSQSLSAH